MRFLVFLLALFLVGCSSGSGSSGTDQPFSYSLDVRNIGTVTYTVLAENGGRVAWYRGTVAAHDKVAYVAEGRITDVNGSFSQVVVDFANAWDEKPRYSPSTLAIVVMSSAFDTVWMPADGAATLQTDLYLGTPEGVFDRLSFFNDLARYSTRVLVTDQEWNATGDKLVVQAQPNAAGLDAEIWLVQLPRAY
jgi:hypothetical protein